MSDKISLAGISKAKVLAGLYNASRPLGMGFLHYDPAPMTEEEAATILEGQTYFDYLKGRVMKTDLSGDTLDPWLYDRDNGEGAALNVIDALRQGEAEDGSTVSRMHLDGKTEAIRDARDGMKIGTKIGTVQDGMVIELGLADVAGALAPMVDKAE